MKPIFVSAVALVLLSAVTGRANAEEFVGPFASWSDVKRDYRLENKGEQRGPAGDDFIRKMLTPLRQARIWLPDEKSKPGRTDVRIHRVFFITGKGGRGVELLTEK